MRSCCFYWPSVTRVLKLLQTEEVRLLVKNGGLQELLLEKSMNYTRAADDTNADGEAGADGG